MSAVIKEFPAPPGWTDKARAEGRKLGQETVAKKAARHRELWAAEVIRKLSEDLRQRHITPRDELVKAIRDLNFKLGLTGNGGQQIKRGTISRWFDTDVENELRMTAIEDFAQDFAAQAIADDRRKR